MRPSGQAKTQAAFACRGKGNVCTQPSREKKRFPGRRFLQLENFCWQSPRSKQQPLIYV
jgi:hypothetical protein